MRTGDFAEKRKFKRLDLIVPTKIQSVLESGKEKEQEGITLNISYNGAYIVNIDIENITENEELKISLTVPRDDTRDFPFSRLIGNAKVIRVDKDGCAVEFGENISRLFVAN